MPLLAAVRQATLPPIELQTQDGDRLRLAAWQHKLVIVNFWATWCAPCRQELVELQRFVDGASDVAVVGLAVDQSGWPAVTPFVRQHGIRFPVALADRRVLRAFGFRGALQTVPQTLVFGADGELLLHAKTALTASDFDVIVANVTRPLTVLRRNW